MRGLPKGGLKEGARVLAGTPVGGGGGEGPANEEEQTSSPASGVQGWEMEIENQDHD